MKKLFLMLACSSMCVMGMNAQEQLVKEVEKELETSKNFVALRTKLQPALTDASTKDLAQTWFVAGQIEMKCFDELYKMKMIGKDVNLKVMGAALLDGIDYMKKVLPLDTVPELDKKTGAPKVDKKTGEVKVKTKYSKD